MGNVNILSSKFFRQALGQSSYAKLTSSICTCNDIAPCARCSPGEDQHAPLSIRLFDMVVLERQNGSAGEGECSSHIDLERILNIFRRDVKERLPNSVRSIKKSDADVVFRFREFCVDSLPDRHDVFIRIRGDGEWCGLEQMIIKLTWGTNANA